MNVADAADPADTADVTDRSPPGLLQPSQLPLVTVPVLAVGVAASFFALLAVTVDPLVTCPSMRLVSAVSRSHLCMMLATISHSLPRVGLE